MIRRVLVPVIAFVVIAALGVAGGALLRAPLFPSSPEPGTAIGVVASALLVVSTVVPRPKPVDRKGSLYAATTRGIRIYLAKPRLRGLLAVHLAAAAAGSMVLVNTLAYVRDVLDRSASDVAIALGFNGVGSLTAALLLPKLLDRVSDRVVVLRAVVGLLASLLVGATFASLLGDWPGPRCWCSGP